MSDVPLRPDSASPTTSSVASSCALHEVSNALTVVLGWLEQASLTDSLDEVRAALEVAREHARRGQVLARRAIGAEVDSGEESRTVESLVGFLSLSLGPQAQGRGVEIDVHLGPGTNARPVDQSSLQQVLTNLLLNAIAFSSACATVTLEVMRRAEHFIFVVEDDGPGVPSDRVATLFSYGDSGRQGGAGIGLSHSRELSRDRGGDLIYARGNRGARFEVTWPVAATSSVRPGSFTTQKILAGARLLVLEDDEAVLSLMQLAFEARGAEVVVAFDQPSFLAALREAGDLDAILMDLSPIEADLERVLRTLEATALGVPLILVSGQPGGAPDALAGRFASWIRKPFDMTQLAEEVSRLLPRGAGQEREAPAPLVVGA